MLFVLDLVAAVGFLPWKTLKALEEKVGLIEVKRGKKSEITTGASGSSPIMSPENLLRIKPESFSGSLVVWIRPEPGLGRTCAV